MTVRWTVVDRRRLPWPLIEQWAARGWRPGEGFHLPSDPWDLRDQQLLRTGVVDDDEQLQAAVLAAVRGVALVVGCVDPDRRSRLVEDLRRLGEVAALDLGPDPFDVLDEDQQLLLSALAAGGSLAAAAAAVHLSIRTSERRIAAARKSLGVRTTAEALARLNEPTSPEFDP